MIPNKLIYDISNCCKENNLKICAETIHWLLSKLVDPLQRKMIYLYIDQVGMERLLDEIMDIMIVIDSNIN